MFEYSVPGCGQAPGDELFPKFRRNVPPFNRGSEVKPQKNGFLEMYCVLLHNCRKYFIRYVYLFFYSKFDMSCYEHKY